MGAWAFQDVLNVGIQIVLLVFTGWCFARFGLLKGEHFMGQINVLLLRVAFPMLNIYLLGIKVDLRDAEAWRSLGAYMLWVTLVQVGIVAYVWSCSGRTIGDAGLLNLVLTANNTVIVGLPVMEATFPDMGSRLSLLTAFVLFLQVIPFSITSFEVEKWMVEDHRRRAAAAATVSEPPSTPDRELSGRWVAGEVTQLPSPMTPGWEDGSVRPGCRAGDGDGSRKGGGAAPAAEPRTPRGSGDGGDGAGGAGHGRWEGLAKSSSGSSSGSGHGAGGGGGGVRSHLRVRGRLGRRRVGSGVVVGTVARGWAPATPIDSPAVSVHGGGAHRGSEPAAAAAAAAPPPSGPPSPPPPPPPAQREDATAIGIGRNLTREATLSPGIAAAAAAAAATAVAAAEAASSWGQPPDASPSLSPLGSGPCRDLDPDRAAQAPVAPASMAELAAAAAAACGDHVRQPPPQEQQQQQHYEQQQQQPTPGSVAVASLDRATSAPCPDWVSLSVGCGRSGVPPIVIPDGDGPRNGDGGGDGPLDWGALKSPSAAPSTHSTASGDSGTGDAGAAAAAAAAAQASASSAFEFRPVGVAAAAAAAAALPPKPPCRHDFHTSLTAPLLTQPATATSTPPTATTVTAAAASAAGPVVAAAPQGPSRPHVPTVQPSLRPRSSHKRIPYGRASADLAGTTACAAAPRRPVGHQHPVGQHLVGAGSTTDGAIQRRSLPVHWPPLGAESAVPTTAAALAAASASVAPPASPPLSRRLLNPLAVACPDLPVPQAIHLARAPTSGVTDGGRLSCNGGAPRRTSCDLAGFAVGDDVSAAGGRATPAGPPGAAISVSLAAGGGAAAAGPADAIAVAAEGVAEAEDSPPPPPDRAAVRAAAFSMTRRHGGLLRAVGLWLRLRLRQYNRAWSITWVIVKNPLLWSLLVALVINLSGLRSVLWPLSDHYRPELGWVAGTLAWTSAITVPVSLFSNGVWLYGKTFGRPTLLQAGGLLLLKLLVLGPLQLACAAACGLEATAAMSLLLLALCPVASTSFVIASQYGHGADLVTAMTMLGIVLLVPAVLVGLAVPRALGLYDYQISQSATS